MSIPFKIWYPYPHWDNRFYTCYSIFCHTFSRSIFVKGNICDKEDLCKTYFLYTHMHIHNTTHKPVTSLTFTSHIKYGTVHIMTSTGLDVSDIPWSNIPKSPKMKYGYAIDSLELVTGSALCCHWFRWWIFTHQTPSNCLHWCWRIAYCIGTYSNSILSYLNSNSIFHENIFEWFTFWVLSSCS